ncbi:MAG: crossover junction endodeoxyribonuclease RuvC, partial [Candidatus Cryptobacteroides sp.]
YGVISVCGRKPELVEAGVVDLRSEKDHFSKLALIAREIGILLDKFQPDGLSIESAFYAKDAQVIQKLGRAQGIIISEAIRRCIPVYEYAPRKAKIAVTGNGAASKEQVAMMVGKQLNMETLPKHLDATDALAIALCHYYDALSPLGGSQFSGGWSKFIAAHPERVKNDR